MGKGSADKLQLSSVEAAQVQAVLRIALEKLSLASIITVDANEQAAELSRSVGDEISRVIQDQRQLEQRFEVLIAQRGTLRAMPNKTKFKENQAELHEVANQLRQSTKLLCRNLKENPNVAGNMLKIQNERIKLQTLLSTCVVDLEDCRYNTLTKTVDEEEAKEKQNAETIERERAATQAVKQLKVQLKEEKTAHDDEMSLKKKALTVLKEELKELKTRTSTQTKYKEKEFHADAQCSRRVQAHTIKDLENEIARLRSQIAIEKQVHVASRDFLTKKQQQMQEEVLSWMAKHEADTQAKDKELDTLKLNHQRDLVKLKELKEKYQQELADREVRLAEERRRQEQENQQMMDMEKQTRAATKIQALYRGWKTRIAVGGGAKAGKGKKGKKKK
mmetsp:Transcript_38464/g.46412  ORF Transcript_38464/g.46412 Transcript_38464/m.46412 type:complete len:391 (+) Transcript_38464:127-1299(+)|eukprot:CAMPEP_0197847658 /NCGR_PEP_ID=MMETSP1438-20131217/6709_1 /TAXON_ID=1461541 /ORGANISM="Pterosperma sp., Strain CCMP1384" /LENGTH=390 /DNA_ID=CAMNT_0043459641 /DNA_START=123 /DNA_END=1295 /DNA_ORIENTATION=+